MMSENLNLRGTILSLAARQGQIIYGQQSINQQVGPFYGRATKDYDILTKQPRKAAEMLAVLLNKRGGDYEVVEAIHRGTFKVRNKTTGEAIADYTRKFRTPKTVNVLGVKFADTSYSKRKIGKILRDPNSSFRWEKDKDTLSKLKKLDNWKW